MSEPKCVGCSRVVATHAPGCSHVVCPHRKPQMWGGTEGLQGFPGTLAEDRVIVRRAPRRRDDDMEISESA